MSKQQATATAPASTDQQKQLPAIYGPRIPFHPVFESQFGIDKVKYTALVNTIFPLAQSADTIFMVLSYCKSRNLDVFKRNVHIVPIWDSKRKCMVDTVWPGIGELRTTAFRTGQYAGRGQTMFGPELTEVIGKVEMTYHEWAQVTVYRMLHGQKIEFTGPRVYWKETYAVAGRDDDSPNTMWRDRPNGQLEKCAEAAALRCAFPEEIGNEITDTEVGNQRQVIDVTATPGASLSGIDQLTNSIVGEQADSTGEAVSASSDATHTGEGESTKDHYGFHACQTTAEVDRREDYHLNGPDAVPQIERKSVIEAAATRRDQLSG